MAVKIRPPLGARAELLNAPLLWKKGEKRELLAELDWFEKNYRELEQRLGSSFWGILVLIPHARREIRKAKYYFRCEKLERIRRQHRQLSYTLFYATKRGAADFAGLRKRSRTGADKKADLAARARELFEQIRSQNPERQGPAWRKNADLEEEVGELLAKKVHKLKPYTGRYVRMLIENQK